MQLALYQPDIPQNLGAMMRLCACLAVKLHIIEPCGFPFDDHRIRRSGMDYIHQLDYLRHPSWEVFLDFCRQHQPDSRLVLATTRGAERLDRFQFLPQDIILMGRESAGVPEEVAMQARCRVRIPMRKEARSLNVAVSSALMLGEGLRQTGAYPLD